MVRPAGPINASEDYGRILTYPFGAFLFRAEGGQQSINLQ